MKINEYVKILVANMLFLCTAWLLTGPVQVTQSVNASHKRDQIIAREILLVDSNGKVRGAFKLDNDETPGLFLTDKNEKVRSYFAYHKGLSRLAFLDKKNKMRMLISYGHNDQPVVSLNYANGEPAIAMSATEQKHAGLAFFSGNSKSKMMIETSDGRSRIGMLDKKERLRIGLGMNRDDSSVLMFTNEDGYPGLGMGHLAGTPMFMLQRPGRTGVFASYAPDNNVILSMQKEGRFTWSVPEIPRGGRAGDDPLNGIDWDNMIKGWNK